jgi:tetratricopeptide (TPR) repeat protein
VSNSFTDDATALSRQAGDSFETERLEEAVALHERALAADGTRVNDWINDGLTLWNLKRSQEAVECYDGALALDQSAALARMNCGNALHDMKRPHQEVLARACSHY